MSSHSTKISPSGGLLDKIFDILKRKGPLCSSQISVELLLPITKVEAGLKKLEEEGIVELRPDRNDSINRNSELTPWGLSRGLSRR